MIDIESIRKLKDNATILTINRRKIDLKSV